MSTSSKKVERVLMVDDDDNIRLIAEMSLEGLTDWQLSTACCGNEALAQIEQHHPDLVLLDMMMPDMDGIAVFKEIKARFGSDAPRVIFMTAKVQTQEIDQYISMGVAGVIMKPFDPMCLPDNINQILATN
ncbi:MAG: response regulator [Candidatus Obscuribacterales bacterium]|nr:response regulator [Candidatus Obscuribacterales bacterium]